MPVAKTYAKMELSGEPFKENGRMYINVITTKGPKKVRWYTDAEYRKMYPEAAVDNNFNACHAFGFDAKGYITVYKGRNVEEWAEKDRTNIWFNLIFGYYTPSKFEVRDVSNGVVAIKLTWDEVKETSTKMKPYEEVTKYVNSLYIPDSIGESKYQGTKDEWLQKEVKVRDKKSKESRYGTKHTYSLVDTEGNTYVWETGSKDYSVDTTVSLKMKVKDHQELESEKVTIVWYCKEQ